MHYLLKVYISSLKSKNAVTKSGIHIQIQCESYVEELTKWLSCNGELWGVGPTALFAAAAALFLYHELQDSVTALGDRPRDSLIEKTLIYSMVLGMLSLMVHMWVCLARFFQYYLDTLITDSPTVLLEMTKAGLRSAGVGQAQLAAVGPLARFLRQQQPQIHITVCWFLALCYADYVRKNYCPGFNLPYLEEWQTELHSQTTRRVRSMLAAVGSFVGAVQARLRAVTPAPRPPDPDTTGRSETALCNESGTEVLENQIFFHDELAACSDATGEAIEKLRAYIKATRCACDPALAGGGAAANGAPAPAPAGAAGAVGGAADARARLTAPAPPPYTRAGSLHRLSQLQLQPVERRHSSTL